MKRSSIVAAIAVSAALIAGCGSSSGGSSSAPGVTATSITFGTHTPLTGPAAPGYSEIAPASQAYFDYVNAHGGVYGRKLHLIIKDDAYNPTNTVNVVKQLVLQDNVFGIFEGLGTPTHTKVVGFLNSSKIPDLFVSSGCPCWDNGATQPETFGWLPNYTIEGKILGQYIKQHFAGEKVGVLYQDDDFGQGGLAGIKDELPASEVVSTQPYQPGVTTLAPQITALKSSGAKVEVNFTIPIYTAIARLTAFTLGYSPHLMVSNVGSDPTTVAKLLTSVSKGKASVPRCSTARSPMATYRRWATPATRGSRCSRRSTTSTTPRRRSTATSSTASPAPTRSSRPCRRRARTSPARTSSTPSIRRAASGPGPGLVPFRYTTTEHGGYAGVEMGVIHDGVIVLDGQPLTTEPTAGRAISPYTGSAGAAGHRCPQQLAPAPSRPALVVGWDGSGGVGPRHVAGVAPRGRREHGRRVGARGRREHGRRGHGRRGHGRRGHGRRAPGRYVNPCRTMAPRYKHGIPERHRTAAPTPARPPHAPAAGPPCSRPAHPLATLRPHRGGPAPAPTAACPLVRTRGRFSIRVARAEV